MASAFSGIFSRSFSSCLDLERCMAPREDSFIWENYSETRGPPGDQGPGAKKQKTCGHEEPVTRSGAPGLTCASFFSMSMRSSASPGTVVEPMRGSVTEGSAGWG